MFFSLFSLIKVVVTAPVGVWREKQRKKRTLSARKKIKRRGQKLTDTVCECLEREAEVCEGNGGG